MAGQSHRTSESQPTLLPQNGILPQPAADLQPQGNAAAQQAMGAGSERPWYEQGALGMAMDRTLLTGDPVLRSGSRGEAVERLQRVLNAELARGAGPSASPPLAVTGVMDAATVSALEQLQRKLGAKPDGVFGPTTADALRHGGVGRNPYRPADPSTRSPVDRQTSKDWRDRRSGGLLPGPQALKRDVSTNATLLAQDKKDNCVETVREMIEPTGGYFGSITHAPTGETLIFSAADKVKNDQKFFWEAGAQLDRREEKTMEEVRKRTLEGVEYIDAELEAGRAVAVGVAGSIAPGATGKGRNRYHGQADDDAYARARKGIGRADHGVAITGRVGGKYVFHDPGGGKVGKFIVDSDGVLKSDPDTPISSSFGPLYYEVQTIFKNVTPPDKATPPTD